MSFNAVDAAKLVDNNILTKDEINFLLKTRDQGVVLDETLEKSKEYQNLQAIKLVQLLPLTHPRTSASVSAVVPTEAGVTLLNELDKRYRENSKTPVAPFDTAPENADQKALKEPVDQELPKTIESKKDKEKAVQKNN